MVKGLDIFRDRFRAFEGAFTLMGGAACDVWFASQGLPFRATKDLDIVLMIEVLDPKFVAALRAFVREGEYEIRERNDGRPVLYRFAKPVKEEFPYMLELFSRSPDGLMLADEQNVVPVKLEPDHHSLSAILLDDDYYGLIQREHDLRDGLRVANAAALIPLKSHAWLDLNRRRAAGETVDTKNITKHRNDVFRLAATLPDEPGPELPKAIVADLVSFLGSFPVASEEWVSILASMKEGIGTLRAGPLRSAIQTYFRLPTE
jgi:hypothetical protein